MPDDLTPEELLNSLTSAELGDAVYRWLERATALDKDAFWKAYYQRTSPLSPTFPTGASA